MATACSRFMSSARLLLVLVPLALSAQGVDPPPSPFQARAISVEGDSPHVDAVLDDAVWSRVPWVKGLTQKDPVEGLPAGEPTEVAFAYDEDNLYVAARLWTPLTGRIHSRMGPRDDMAQTQSFFIALDTYHDHRTAYTLGVTAAGVRVDFHHPEDKELMQVMSWDPVWEVRTRVLDDHWVVEARVPFSQLRFNPVDEQVWGLQIDRWTPERQAEDYWVMVPRAETGWASRFGELRGIKGIRPRRRVEVLPYLAGEWQALHDTDPTDPFSKAHSGTVRAGGDLKMGLGPNLTLDATFNPDFGQVEADPASINLTAYETTFEERRPFFLEGDRLLRGLGPRYYYSRRIGAPPDQDALPDTITHVDMPSSTRILAAAKLSGRLVNGLSVAALAALTDKEFADLHNAYGDSLSRRTADMVIQPRTGSSVLRLQQEVKGGSVVGLTLTGLHRDFNGSRALERTMTRDAFSGGADWRLRSANGLHEVSGFAGFSRVSGDSAALLAIQRSSVHYFQRPDAPHVRLDPGREALSGWTGKLALARVGGRHARWNLGLAAESPGFELNDMGQLGSADDIDSWLTLSWDESAGKGLFRSWSAWQSFNASWNFSGLPTTASTNMGMWGQFRNYWSVDVNVDHGSPVYSDSYTWGGPVTGAMGWNSLNLSFSSPDLQRPNSLSAGLSSYAGEDHNQSLTTWFFLRLRPTTRLEFRLNPSAARTWDPGQYLATFGEGMEALTLLSRLDYREVRLALRTRYTPTPRLRLEFYAEPFMASLRFSDPGRPAGGRSQHIRRFADEGRMETGSGGEWIIDDSRVPGPVQVPNYEYASWRSTCVLRWDWRLGSSLYLVWQQNRARYLERRNPDRTPDPLQGLSRGGDNLLALKLSWWLPVG